MGNPGSPHTRVEKQRASVMKADLREADGECVGGQAARGGRRARVSGCVVSFPFIPCSNARVIVGCFLCGGTSCNFVKK
jgi:hypothetical protein